MRCCSWAPAACTSARRFCSAASLAELLLHVGRARGIALFVDVVVQRGKAGQYIRSNDCYAAPFHLIGGHALALPLHKPR